MFPARLALLGAASLLVLASLGPPAVAQQAAAPAPAVAGPALPIALPPLPQVQDAPWPGVVRLQVAELDARAVLAHLLQVAALKQRVLQFA